MHALGKTSTRFAWLALLSVVACGSTQNAPATSFGDAASQDPDASTGTSSTSSSNHGSSGESACTLPDGEVLDAGAAVTGLVELAAIDGGVQPYAYFSSTLTTEAPIACLGPPVNAGGCCIGWAGAIISSVQNADPGTITFTEADAGTQMALVSSATGFYDNPSPLPPWTAGETLSVRAPGNSVAALDASVTAPHAAANVKVGWIATGTGNPSVALDTDLVVSWTPGPAEEVLRVTIYQSTGSESCIGPMTDHVRLADPLAVFCNVPSSLGTVTVPTALLGEAHFTTGTGTLSVSSATQAFVWLPDVAHPTEQDEVEVLAIDTVLSTPINLKE